MKISEILGQLNSMQDELVEESYLRYKYQIQLLEQASPAGREIKRKNMRATGQWSVTCRHPTNTQATSAYFRDEEAKELPSTSHIHSCRNVVQYLNTMLVAYVLANSTAWTELFTDGTTRRQTPMQNLIIQFVQRYH